MRLDRRSMLLATLAVALPLPALADEVDDVLGRITEARKRIKTLQAPFTQTRVIGLLASEVKSEGKLTLVRPDRLRWDLFPPDAVTYWIGPDGLAMRNEDGVTKVGKAAAGRFAAVLGDLLVMLGGDMRKLRERYEIKVKEQGSTLLLQAVPKDETVKKHVSKLRMKATDAGQTIERIEIHEKGGDRSIIRFGTFTKNEPVKDEVIEPPKG